MKRNPSKIIIVVTMIIVMACSLFGCVENNNNLPEHTDQFYVNDFANVFKDKAQVNRMVDNAAKFAEEHYGAQVVVVTINFLSDYIDKEDYTEQDFEDFATDLFNYYEIGDKDEDNGILILASIGDGFIKIEAGYGINSLFENGKCEEIQDEGIKKFNRQTNEFADGFEEMQSLFFDEFEKAYSKRQRIQNSESISQTQEQVLEPIKEIPESSESERALPVRANEESTVNEESSNEASDINKTQKIAIVVIGCLYAFCTVLIIVVHSRITGKLEKQINDQEDNVSKLKDTNQMLDGVLQEETRKKEALQAENQALKRQIQDLYKSDREKNEKNAELEEELGQYRTKLEKASSNLEEKNSFLAWVRKLYPDIDQQVENRKLEEKIAQDKEAAEAFDNLTRPYINKNPSSDIIRALEKILESFGQLTDDQKKYVLTNIPNLRQLLVDSKQKEVEERAERLRSKIEEVLSTSKKGTESMLERLSQLIYEYEGQPANVKLLIDTALIEKLHKYHSDAENEKQERLDKEAAVKIEKDIRNVCDSYSDGKWQGLTELREVKNRYDALSKRVKVKVQQSLLSRLESLLRRSEENMRQHEQDEENKRKASSFCREIEEMTSLGIYVSDPRGRASRAQELLDRINSAKTDVRAKIQSDKVSELESYIRRLNEKADDDDEEEERRRRASSSSSSYGFGGFGGSSSSHHSGGFSGGFGGSHHSGSSSTHHSGGGGHSGGAGGRVGRF